MNDRRSPRVAARPHKAVPSVRHSGREARCAAGSPNISPNPPGPQTLIVDFISPNTACIAAQADAFIGRGGAILVSVWVDAERTDEPSTASADSNRIRTAVIEAIGGATPHGVPTTRNQLE